MLSDQSSDLDPPAGVPPRPPSGHPAAREEILEAALFEAKRVLVGQDRMIERLLRLLARPGPLPARRRARPGQDAGRRRRWPAIVGGSFARIQFTPDLVPADLVGTRIYRPSREAFDVELGPVFANVVLADEINRAPAKVQSALLEVMAERHVSIGGVTYAVPDPFLVLATQNPIESEGVYPLPEAQRDRFLMKVLVDYPNGREEAEIVRRMGVAPAGGRSRCSTHERLLRACRRPPTTCSSTTRSSTTPCAWCWPPASRPSTASPTSTPSSPTAPAPAPRLGLVAAGRALALLRGRAYVAAAGRLRRRPRRPAPPPRAVLRRASPTAIARRAGRRARRPTVPAPRVAPSPGRSSDTHRSGTIGPRDRRRHRVDRRSARGPLRQLELHRHPQARRPAPRRPPGPRARRPAARPATAGSTSPATTSGASTGTSPPGRATSTCATRSPTASSRRGSSSTAAPASTSARPTARSATSPSPSWPRSVSSPPASGNRTAAVVFDGERHQVVPPRGGPRRLSSRCWLDCSAVRGPPPESRVARRRAARGSASWRGAGAWSWSSPTCSTRGLAGGAARAGRPSRGRRRPAHRPPGGRAPAGRAPHAGRSRDRAAPRGADVEPAGSASDTPPLPRRRRETRPATRSLRRACATSWCPPIADWLARRRPRRRDEEATPMTFLHPMRLWLLAAVVGLAVAYCSGAAPSPARHRAIHERPLASRRSPPTGSAGGATSRRRSLSSV